MAQKVHTRPRPRKHAEPASVVIKKLDGFFKDSRKSVAFLRAHAGATIHFPTAEKVEHLSSRSDREIRPNADGWVYRALSEHFNDVTETLDFMRHFAGQVCIMPAMPDVEAIELSESIIRAIGRDPSAGTAKRLADMHNIPAVRISKLVKRRTGKGISQRRAELNESETLLVDGAFS